MRSHEARPGTVPQKPELWGATNIAVPQSKLWGGQSFPAPMIYATHLRNYACGEHGSI